MKNKLWRFGDSWSKTQDDTYSNIELNHSHYIADYFGLELNHLGCGGFSNLQIFKKILENTHLYSPNDIILINFASISRVSIIDGDTAICTADGGISVFENKILRNVILNDVGDTISDILFYLIKAHLESLINAGVKVYHFYNDSSDEVLLNKIPNNLLFKNTHNMGYIGWCKDNGYEDLSPTGNLHYTLGCQRDVANKIIELIKAL
jgi:hypothetical protein